MSVRRGIRRSIVYVSILYWAVVAKIAVLRAMYGVWDPSGPMGFLGCAALVYAVIFGFFWALDGFVAGPPPPW